jgi:hypothetical protein
VAEEIQEIYAAADGTGAWRSLIQSLVIPAQAGIQQKKITRVANKIIALSRYAGIV